MSIVPTSGSLPIIRSCQVGLRKPAMVDQIKSDIRSGRFAFSELRGQIGGWRDRRGIFYVNDGHHRMVAAIEIFQEDKELTFVLELIRWGHWTEIDKPPVGNRPMPSRKWWGSLRNWLGI